ncbi:PKD domain-containing protein, partial [Fulvivirga lutimaris]|uniref:PKD domain-containing protein n=1 Tax=Fulvivirga lutimaris TaxID=1819566 RepID=UPI0012BD12FE
MNFGNSLMSNPSADVLLEPIGGTIVGGIDIAVDKGNHVMILSNSNDNKLSLINFGDSPGNNPIPSDIVTTAGFGIASGLDDIRVEKFNDNWYAFSGSIITSRVVRFDFGPNLYNASATPTLITTNLSGQQFRGIEIAFDNGNWFGYAITIAGELFRINFGSSLNNNSPVVDALGVDGNLDRPFHIELIKFNSQWKIFSMDADDKNLVVGDFPSPCDMEVYSSKDEIPNDIRYSSNGTFNISLLAKDGSGEESHLLKSIEVNTFSAPPITISSQNICLTSPIQFTSESSAGGLTYDWDFGDGSPTDANANPSHSFTAAGEYEVTLSVQDGTCSNFTKQTITIYEEPAPDFTVPGGNICTNQPYLFEITTPGDFGGFITYSWVLDGVPISTDQDLDITFSNGGSKELKLIATIPGCDIEIAKNLTNVKEGTLPIFSFDDSCVGEEVLFTNSTSGDITDVNWEFSNGFTSTLSNPIMIFDTEGTYDVTLNITNADGCETFDTQTITIHALPVIDFSNELACEKLATQFEDLSTVNIDNLSSWSWDFGDGTEFSEEQNTSHFFDANGDYEVELTATSSFGCVDSLTKMVTVLKAPEVAFNFDKICIDVPIQFSDASVAVEGEEITDWSWNLGGTFSAQQNPQTTFENPLDYSVSLTVTSSNLCTATQTQLVSIPEAPSLDFSLADDCENETAQITDITEISGDNISNRSWLINGSQVSSESNFGYDFAQAGNYNVTLSVYTENGCEYEVSRAVTIHQAPTASFSTSFDFGAPPFVVDFTNQSSGAQSYSWEFEEEATSEETNPSHTFNNLGDFDVSLVAISDQNCTDTISSRIQVLEPLLDAEVLNFNILPTASGDKLSFAIRNNGTIRLDSLSVTVNLGGELEIYETINKAMNPNEVISAQLALTIDNKRLDYICIDVRPFILNYQDVDEDNNRSCITFGQETFIISNPYPNPSTSLVAFDIIATKDAIADIELLSSTGDLIDMFNVEVYEGNNKLDFDLNQLKSGLY